MNKDEARKHKDTDILRAKDIIPPYNTTTPRQLEHSVKNETSPPANAPTQHDGSQPSKVENNTPEKDDIPQFDLANQILSEQRKVTTIKRKRLGPQNESSRAQPKVPSTVYTLKPPPILSQQEKIIAQIVARDIQNLRKCPV